MRSALSTEDKHSYTVWSTALKGGGALRISVVIRQGSACVSGGRGRGRDREIKALWRSGQDGYCELKVIVQDLISKNSQRTTHLLPSPHLLCLNKEVGAMGELGASLSRWSRNKILLWAWAWSCTLLGKAREVKIGIWFFLDAWPRALGWEAGSTSPCGSKDVLTGTATTHIALSGLGYRPRDWVVSHSYGSF